MKSQKMLTALAVITRVSPTFNNGAGWKMEGDKIVMKDGNPVYVQTDGSEITVDHATIGQRNAEAKKHREEKEAAQAELKKYEGIDPVAARKALETVGKLDQKQLIDAGKVDEVKREITGQFQTQLDAANKANADLQSQVNGMKLQTAFDGSEFIREKIAVPVDMIRANFAGNFKFEDGNIVPYDATGSKIMSKKRMGEVADFNEAIERIVEDYPHKTAILKADGHSGSGNNGGGGGRAVGSTMKRERFNALSPGEQSAIMAKGEVTVVD